MLAGGVGNKYNNVKNKLIIVDHTKREMMIAVEIFLFHTEVNTKRTIIVTGTA